MAKKKRTAKKTKRRRKRQERSVATRERLLEATFDCLVEVGYASTTTPEVLRRTGISRGALLHHFPTSEDLLLAAVDYVLLRQLQAYRDTFRGREGRVTGEEALELLWEMMHGPSFYAWLELTVAARTDRRLLRRVRKVSERFTEEAQRIHGEVFGHPQAGEQTVLGIARRFSFAVLHGMAVRLIWDDPEMVHSTLNPLKMMVPMMGR